MLCSIAVSTSDPISRSLILRRSSASASLLTLLRFAQRSGRGEWQSASGLLNRVLSVPTFKAEREALVTLDPQNQECELLLIGIDLGAKAVGRMSNRC
jgi:hypothetical protein